MEFISNIMELVKGGLLSKDNLTVCIRLLDSEKQNEGDAIKFTNEELVRIYISVNSIINFAPEENTKFEIEQVKLINDKIEKYENYKDRK